jgi:hypothetical protein
MLRAEDFDHLDVSGFLTEDEWSFEGQERLAATVTGKGIHYLEAGECLVPPDKQWMVILSTHGLLQVCLSRTQSFQDCTADQIRDLRAIPIKASRCQDRRLLIETLADALLWYEKRQTAMAADVEGMSNEIRRAWQIVGAGLDAYLDLRKKGKLPQPVPHTSPKRKTQQRARQIIEQMVQALPPEACMHAARISRTQYRTDLYRDMQAAFADYGPPIKDFPGSAVHYALALILSRLHVEKGTKIVAIADRIRKRLDRIESLSSMAEKGPLSRLKTPIPWVIAPLEAQEFSATVPSALRVCETKSPLMLRSRWGGTRSPRSQSPRSGSQGPQPTGESAGWRSA